MSLQVDMEIAERDIVVHTQTALQPKREVAEETHQNPWLMSSPTRRAVRNPVAIAAGPGGTRIHPSWSVLRSRLILRRRNEDANDDTESEKPDTKMGSLAQREVLATDSMSLIS
jgi:hypothetical protein